MARKTFQINGVDYTSCCPPAGYTVQYKKVDGGNSGTMLNGAFTEDTIALKAVVHLQFMPLTETQQSNILKNLLSDDYATIYYFDPHKNAYRSAVMTYEIEEAKHRGTSVDTNEYWTGLALTLTDRYNMG